MDSYWPIEQRDLWWVIIRRVVIGRFKTFSNCCFFAAAGLNLGVSAKQQQKSEKSQNFLEEKSFEQIELGELGQISPLSEKNGKKEYFC